MKSKAMVVLAVLTLMLVSGCFEKKFEEMSYEEHLYAAGKEGTQGLELKLWEKAVNASKEERYDDAIKFLKEMKKIHENMLLHELAAVNATDDPKKKKVAEYEAESAKYIILADEKYIETMELSKEGKEELALVARTKGSEYVDEALKIGRKADEIRAEIRFGVNITGEG